MKYIQALGILFLVATVFSCGFSTEKRRPEAIEETLSERSVKKISEADILNEVTTQGDSITTTAQAVFLSKISEQYAKGGFEKAAEYCAIDAYPLTDSLAAEYKVFLKRVSLKPRNTANTPSEVEKGLLEAYEYANDQGLALNTNVQFIRPGDTILYNKPIFVASELCLNCHGPKEELSEGVKALLADKYPEDKATGYAIGDLRGMWSLKFLKKEIVKGL
jgi:hypothetical protein